jgi:hypothetical protein
VIPSRRLLWGFTTVAVLLAAGCESCHRNNNCCDRRPPVTAAAPACCPDTAPMLPGVAGPVPIGAGAPGSAFYTPGGCCGAP